MVFKSATEALLSLILDIRYTPIPLLSYHLFQGTGRDQHSLSDWVISLKLVDGNGDVRSLPDDIGTVSVSPDDVLKAAQATMGIFGVVLEFTVKVQPMSHCQVNNIFNLKMEVISS